MSTIAYNRMKTLVLFAWRNVRAAAKTPLFLLHRKAIEVSMQLEKAERINIEVKRNG
ncbi:hypothetical protein NDS46_29600 [Paenibacillus thiaminolyticus]|uniref:hypothetical protein n=1 Tax=Paenibacillus thiaminolyticus TaxID=49283 RepID=UPI00232FE165|nr:hypothetical protein [Paenibacillus thiaminolyticus]WCF08355.1 hypothetical protein NDS46_29600 [Paenibacillus thiaminolyticus]